MKLKSRRIRFSVVFRAFMKNTDFFMKLLASFIVMVIIPVTLISLIFFNKFKQLIRQEVFNLYEQVVDQYVDNINYKLNVYENYLENLTLDSLLLDLFEDPETKTLDDIIAKTGEFSKEVQILTFRGIKNDIYNVKFYSAYDGFPSDGRYISNNAKAREEDWYERVFSGDDIEFYYVTKGLKHNIISLFRPLLDYSGDKVFSVLGIVKVDIYANSIFSQGSSESPSLFEEYYIYNKYNENIYSSNATPPVISDEIWYSAMNTQSGINIVEIDGVQNVIAYREINDYGWKGLFVFKYDRIQQETLNIGLSVIILVFSILLFFIILILIMSRALSSRIILLAKKITKVGSGDLSSSPTIDGKDEIAVIDHQFNEMVIRLNQLLSEVYIKEIEKRDAEINALQHQVNPHFYYNALEMISSMISLNSRMELSAVCRKLGETLRYNFSNDNGIEVLLEKEIDHIKNYLFIQKIRFRGNFEVYYDIPRKLLECKVIKFILQPIVENIFKHAWINHEKTLCIEISAQEISDYLLINIKDNGSGLSVERLATVLSILSGTGTESNSEQSTCIGLKNINERIKLYYAGSYGLSIGNITNSGTQVSIRLPLQY